MVARTDGVGQFVVDGNFELDTAVLEGLRSMLVYCKREFALIERFDSSSPYFRHRSHFLTCIRHVGMGTASQDRLPAT